MKLNFFNFTIYFLIISVALFLQNGRWLDIKNTTPNLIILGWLAVALLIVKEGHFRALLCLPFLFLLSYMWAPFFGKQFLILGILIAPIIFLNAKLTGDFYIDFTLSFLLLLFAFYFLNNNFHFSYSLLTTILKELVYDFFIGGVFLIFINRPPA